MLLRILDRLEEILIASLIAAATILIFISVVHRFGTGVPFLYPYLIRIHISWAQELCIYMFIWMAKFGAAYGVRTGIHVGVDVLINRLNPRWQRGVILFGLFGGAFFTFVVGTMGAKFVIELMSTDHIARSRIAELDCLRLHPARLLSDEFPVSAGGLGVLEDRRIAAS
jgi:C4-dicarboxylate transporter, DctQ subunit